MSGSWQIDTRRVDTFPNVGVRATLLHLVAPLSTGRDVKTQNEARAKRVSAQPSLVVPSGQSVLSNRSYVALDAIIDSFTNTRW